MPRLSRAFLDRIGVLNSKFVEAMIDFRHPGNKKPVTTVILAENGTGKSQVLRLILNSIVPVASRRMKLEAQGDQKSYFDIAIHGHEVGLVLMEWVPDAPGGGASLFEEVFDAHFITGMLVYRKGDGMQRHFFSLQTRDGVVDSSLEGLITYLTGQSMGNRPNGEGMLARIDKLKKEPALAVFETDTQKRWEEHEARVLGLDIKAFEMQVPMNMQEASAGDALVFKDERHFIDYVVELLIPGADGWEATLDRIDKLRDHLVREIKEVKPAMEGLRRMQRPLWNLGRNLNERILAARAMAGIANTVSSVSNSLAAKRNLVETEVVNAKNRQQGLQDQVRALKAEAEGLKRGQESLMAWGGRRKLAKLDAELHATTERRTTVGHGLLVMEASGLWESRAACLRNIDSRKEFLASLDKGEDELLGEIRGSALRVVGGWSALDQGLVLAIADLQGQMKAAEGDANANRKALSMVENRLGELTAIIAGLAGRIQEVQDEGYTLMADGVMAAGEEPVEALTRIGLAQEDYQSRVAALRLKVERVVEDLDAIKDVLGERKQEQSTLTAQHRQDEADVAAWLKAMGTLVKDDWLTRLADQNLVDDETDQAQLDRVMALLPNLVQKAGLMKAAIEARLTEARDAQRELNKLLERMESQGALPSTSDAEQLVKALRLGLRHGGVWSGPGYLSDLKDEPLAQEALRALPGLAEGVVVKDEFLGRIAGERLGENLVLAHPVAVYSESMVRGAQAVAGTSFAVVGLGGKWWFNPEEFKRELVARRQELAELGQRAGKLAAESSALTDYQRSLDSVQERWGGRIEGLRSNLVSMRMRLDAINYEIPETEARMRRLQDERKGLQDQIAGEDLAARDLPRRLARIEVHQGNRLKVPAWTSDKAAKEEERLTSEERKTSLLQEGDAIRARLETLQGRRERAQEARREPLDHLRRLQGRTGADVAPLALERAVLEGETKALYAKEQALEARTVETAPQRNDAKRMLKEYDTELRTWDQRLAPFFAKGLTEVEVAECSRAEAEARGTGAVPGMDRLRGEAHELDKASAEVREAMGKIKGELDSLGLNDVPNPDPEPRDDQESEAWFHEMNARMTAIAVLNGQNAKSLAALAGEIELQSKAIIYLGDGQRVVETLSSKSDEMVRAYAGGLRDLELMVLTGEAGSTEPQVVAVDDAARVPDLEPFDLPGMRAWAGARGEEARLLGESMDRLARDKEVAEGQVRKEASAEVFGQPCYYQFRSCFVPVSIDTSLATIFKEVDYHLEVLSEELRTQAETKKVIQQALANLAMRGLDWIQRLGSIAKFPDKDFSVPELRGKHYLKVSCHPLEESLRAEVLDNVLNEFLVGKTGDGIRLAQMVIQKVANVKGVRMRHPDPHRITNLGDGMEDIRMLAKVSGGERLAQVLMLYSALTRLRNGGKSDFGGVLFMDNPFGALTRNVFLEQVRAVAASFNIQLVFTCGVMDAPSISDYDHFVAFRKQLMDSTAMGEYYQIEVAHVGRMEDIRRG